MSASLSAQQGVGTFWLKITHAEVFLCLMSALAGADADADADADTDADVKEKRKRN